MSLSLTKRNEKLGCLLKKVRTYKVARASLLTVLVMTR